MTARKSEPSKTTALTKWDEELAKQAQVAAGMEESTATGRFFSTKGGILSWNDAAIPNNQMAVVIVDFILENVFYEGKFDANQPQGPTCFAFARNDKDLKPHQIVVDSKTAQCDTCKDCRLNEWGTSDVGRGKACRNTRRLALIPAGNLDANGRYTPFDDPSDALDTASLGFLKLPVTSVKGFAAFVKQIAGALKRPPHGVVAKVKVIPDVKSQFKVTFEPVQTIPNEWMTAIMKRHDEAVASIDFPYTPFEDAPPAPSKGKATRVPARGAKPRGRKY
jgi:hypothetical protein